MDTIAYMIGDTFLYWNSVILTLAALTAVCFFLAFYLKSGENILAAETVVPLAIVLSIVASRVFHWYSRWDSYASLQAAVTDYTYGGFALLGCFVGCFLAAVIVWILRLERNLPKLLDSMSLAGAAGIAVGRLACFYSPADRGQILESITELPWAFPITNSVSGALEYRLATFVIQSMVTGFIFVVLVLHSFSKKRRSGDITMLFLLMYGASQAMLDSTRYDSLYFRSNGFVSIVQVVGLTAAVVMTVVFSIRMVRSRGWNKLYLGLWIPMLVLLGCAGYMEYHVQRHGDQARFAYTVMSAGLAVFVLLSIFIYSRSVGRKHVPIQDDSTNEG